MCRMKAKREVVKTERWGERKRRLDKGLERKGKTDMGRGLVVMQRREEKEMTSPHVEREDNGSAEVNRSRIARRHSTCWSASPRPFTNFLLWESVRLPAFFLSGEVYLHIIIHTPFSIDLYGGLKFCHQNMVMHYKSSSPCFTAAPL